MAPTSNLGQTAEPIDETLLERLLLASPNLSSIRSRLPEMTPSQKQALVDRLQTLQSNTFRSSRIQRRERSTLNPPSIAGLSNEAVSAELTALFARREFGNLASVKEKLPTFTIAQRRELLQQLLNRSHQHLKTARLSYAQQRCFFLEHLTPGTGSHNISSPVRAQGPINLDLVERCINIIVDRHETLRTNFRMTPDGPVQMITPSRKIKIVETTVEAGDVNESDNAIIEAVRREAYCPFDLSSDPLIRINSFYVSDNERILLLTLHHIISDQWSIGIFLQELGALYATGGNPEVLPDLSIQYADYAEWQLDKVTPETIAPELEYWTKHLSGAPQCLEIPPDYPRPRVRTTNGSFEQIMIQHDVFRGIVALAQSEQATLFMALLAAFKLLIATRVGREDILIGTDFANRNRGETEHLIGLFVNGLVLRSDLSGDPSFRDILRRVRRSALDAFSHPELPFHWLVEHLRPERDSGRTPLYQIVFDLHNIPMQLEFDGITFLPLRLPLRPAKYDITMFVKESPRDLHASLEYNTDLYSRDTAVQFLRDYSAILTHVAINPEAPFSSFVPLARQVETS